MPEDSEKTSEPTLLQKIAADQKNKKDDERQGLPDTVKVETASAPMKLSGLDYKNSDGPWIEYTGVATVRRMGPEEWAAANINSQDYFEWNYLNHKRIPRKVFTDEQLQYLLRVDDRFRLVDK